MVPFISIIMPVFNVELFLEKSIKSVLKQSYSNFELILVDDCSQDASGLLCDKLGRENPQISVLHHRENRGLSEARNSGLSVASGKYILFMDSDDYIDEMLLEVVHNTAEQTNAQVIIFGLNEIYCDRDGQELSNISLCPSNGFFKGKYNVRCQVAKLDREIVGRFAWNKIYQRSFLEANSIVFESLEPIEDICFNLKVYDSADSMVTIDSPLYFYVKRSNLATLSNIYSSTLFDLFKVRYQRIQHYHRVWGITDKEIIQINHNVHLRHIVTAIQKISISKNLCVREKRERIQEILLDPSTLQCVNEVQCGPFGLSLLKRLIKWRLVFLISIASFLLYIIKNRFPQHYGRLRLKR